jgi:hypothetical protein
VHTKGSSGAGAINGAERKILTINFGCEKQTSEQEARAALDMGERSRWQGFQSNGCR